MKYTQDMPRRMKLADVDITHPKLETAIAAVKNWHKRLIGGQATNLVFISLTPGVGKTMLAKICLWAKHIQNRETGMPIAPLGKLFKASDLVAAIRGGSTPEIEINGRPIVVIDDITKINWLDYTTGQEQATQKQLILFQIIDYCTEQDIAIIITGKMKPIHLKNVLGDDGFNRFMMRCPKLQFVDMEGTPSYRSIKRREL